MKVLLKVLSSALSFSSSPLLFLFWSDGVSWEEEDRRKRCSRQRRREGEGKYRNGDLWYNINYIYLVHSSRQVQWKKINVNFQDYRTNVLLGFENTSRMNTNAKSFLFGFFSKNVEWWPRFWKLDEAYSANSGATMNTTSSNFVESCWRIVVFT